MKNARWLLVLLLLLAPLCAHADIARDVTHECAFSMPYAASKTALLSDRNYETMLESNELTEPVLYITSGDTPLSALYVAFGRKPLAFDVQVKEAGAWRTAAHCDGAYHQAYVDFPPVSGELRLRFDTHGKSARAGISEIYCYSEGAVDESVVHIWQPTVEKADLLIAVAHPDDELLWLGGCIPYYAGERQLQVAVMYLTCSHPFRTLELLDGLWHCGVRHYPLLAGFQDVQTTSVEDTYQKWGRANVNAYLINALRTLRPEVVVTHGFDGEYGHFHHVTCAYSVQRTAKMANEENKYSALPLWQVKKVYHHGGDNPTTVMDWDQPLTAFQGKTGYDMACEGFAKHISQNRTWYSVAKRHERWDSYVYTLTASTVGDDVLGGDLFENIPAECISTYNK